MKISLEEQQKDRTKRARQEAAKHFNCDVSHVHPQKEWLLAKGFESKAVYQSGWISKKVVELNPPRVKVRNLVFVFDPEIAS